MGSKPGRKMIHWGETPERRVLKAVAIRLYQRNFRQQIFVKIKEMVPEWRSYLPEDVINDPSYNLPNAFLQRGHKADYYANEHPTVHEDTKDIWDSVAAVVDAALTPGVRTCRIKVDKIIAAAKSSS